MHPHLTRKVRENDRAILERNTKQRVGERLLDRSLCLLLIRVVLH